MAREDKKRDKQITREIHRLFWRANWQAPVELITTYACRIPAYAAYNVIIPLMSAYAIRAILNGNTHQVKVYALSVIGLALAYSVLTIIGDTVTNRNGVIASKYVQREVFANFLQKDYAFYGNTFFGSLGAQVARLRDAYDKYSFIFTNSIPKQVVIVSVSIAVIAWHSALLAVVTLVMMVLVLSFTLYTSSWRLKFRRGVSEAGSKVAADVGDALTQGTTVKSFANEAYETKMLEASLQMWGRAQYRSWMSSIPADIGRMTLASIATAVLLIFSSHLYQQDAIDITIVILIQLYVVRLVTTTLDIAEIVKGSEEAMGAAYEPLKTMLINPTVTDKPKTQSIDGQSPLTTAFKNVTFSYGETRKGRPAVVDFSLTIAPGEKIGVVGYSGSGKTTLTKLLMRFMDVTDGGISINGVDIRDMRQQDLRQLISYVPQEPLLFHRSIFENIAYGRPEAPKAAVLAAAKAAYVYDFVSELPDGYDTLVGERGVKLSGGQRQRVAIARAILRNAPILVLDEATSALDSRSEQYIQKALWKLMKGRTALVIAHRLSTIQRMDRIAVMDKGRIVQLGTHEELLGDKKGIYAELWSHQSGGYVGLSDKNQMPDDTTA